MQHKGQKKFSEKIVYFYPEIAGKPSIWNISLSAFPYQGLEKYVGVDKFADEYTLVDADVEGKNYHEVATSLSENEYTLNAEVAPSSILVDSVSDAFYADPESEYIQPIYVLEGSEENQTEKSTFGWMHDQTNFSGPNSLRCSYIAGCGGCYAAAFT